jgi:1,4-dihydroxy-2-naphthoate octaprenyltransferase
MGGLTTAILVVNNLRDIDTDTKVGKRTLAVRLGAKGTKAEFVLMLLIAFAAPVVGILFFDWPVDIMVTWLALPFCIQPVRTVLTFQDPRALFPALGQTSRVVAIYGVLMMLGLALG